MYTLEPSIVEGRLAIIKAFKEAPDDANFNDVLEQIKPELHALGAHLQFHINVLYTQYASVGLGFDEFFDDLIEWLHRSGFVYHDARMQEYDRANGIKAYDIHIALDHDFLADNVMLTFQVIEDTKNNC